MHKKAIYSSLAVEVSESTTVYFSVAIAQLYFINQNFGDTEWKTACMPPCETSKFLGQWRHSHKWSSPLAI